MGKILELGKAFFLIKSDFFKIIFECPAFVSYSNMHFSIFCGQFFLRLFFCHLPPKFDRLSQKSKGRLISKRQLLFRFELRWLVRKMLFYRKNCERNLENGQIATIQTQMYLLLIMLQKLFGLKYENSTHFLCLLSWSWAIFTVFWVFPISRRFVYVCLLRR